MLESLTIFTSGGAILYEYVANPSLLKAENPTEHSRQLLNQHLITDLLIGRNDATKTYAIVQNVTLLWKITKDFTVVALYPDILFDGPRLYLKQWATQLVDSVAKEYRLYHHAQIETNATNNASFDATFRILLEQSKAQKQDLNNSNSSSNNNNNTTTSTNNNSSNNKSKKPGKEMRTWGNAKVTEASMNALDMNKQTEADKQTGYEQALAEAKQAYLPDANDETADSIDDTTNDTSDSTSLSVLSGLFEKLSFQKTLTADDLEGPCQSLEQLLISKNVAQVTSRQLVDQVRTKLIGKRLKNLYSVQTAVQQSLESTLQQILKNKSKVDLVKNIKWNRLKRPYVIGVMGINGIGKTTTIAKLAYYLKNNKCRPMLVAGDTFRSGAVEQLQIHADCLNVDFFKSGYAKDPSQVCGQGILAATENGNDVVLVDTAGRMQNNANLMRALTKLVEENRPDCMILVAEALVGHDGLNQYDLFSKAAQKIHGLILTKLDTVDSKVGAILTLTHQTSTPILFLGVGQKYHHLKKLEVATVLKALLKE